MTALAYILVLFWVFIGIQAAVDPCTDHRIIYDEPEKSRSINCGGGSDYCDRYINEDWYQVVNSDGTLQMPTDPVSVNSCGAVYPIWLNGTYPDVADGVVNMTACVVVPSNSCGDVYTIQVKNCEFFYVFYFQVPRGCPERYCFGTGNKCPETTTTTTTSTTTTTTTPPKTTSSVTTVTSTSGCSDGKDEDKDGPSRTDQASEEAAALHSTGTTMVVISSILFVVSGIICVGSFFLWRKSRPKMGSTISVKPIQKVAY